LQSVFLEKVSIKVNFENCGEIVSLSDIEFVARTHAKDPYSSPGLIVVHFELVGFEKMGMTLENLVEMMSLTCFEEFVIGTQAWLLYVFVFLIFLQLLGSIIQRVERSM